MKKVLNYAHLFKTSEDCDKFSTRFLHKNLIAGTAISGSAEKQTQCLSNGSAITPLTAVSTLKSLFRNSSKVMEKLLQILQRHSEAEPKNPRKVQHNDWILHFAFAPFRMTIPAQALALILTFGTISESRADAPAGCIGEKMQGPGYSCSSCEDGYELYSTYWFKSCRKSCTANEERVDGVCVEKCASTQERSNGVCVAIPTCEKGGSACRTSSGALVSNCCYKTEGDTTTVYPDNPELEYDAYAASLPNNKNLVISSGATNYNCPTKESGYENLYVSEGTSMKANTCNCCFDTSHLKLFMPDEGAYLQGINASYTLTIVCLGDIDKCKENAGPGYANRVVSPTESQCNGSGTYYYTGSECVKRPEAGTDITCDYEVKGYVKVGNYCASPENSYAKKHYTPAEAAQWLKDDDNTVVLTFKK